MSSELGSFLRQLRLSRQVSQAGAARLIGIGRVTLNRWESGVQQPREVEIEGLLAALSTTQAERRQLAALYQTAGTRLKARDAFLQVGVLKGIGPLPQNGDLLRALRLRRNLSQAEVATCIGVTVRTVRRWELSETGPSSTQLSALCSALDASPEETTALSEERLITGASLHNVSLEALRQQGKELHAYNQQGMEKSLKDLGFLTLESQVWPFAARSAGGREVLAQLYGYHAHYLDSLKRFTESGVYAQRSLDLVSGTTPLWGVESPAAIVAARSAMYRGAHPDAVRGIEILLHWVDVPQETAYKAWLLSDLAKYTAQIGNLDESFALAQRAIVVAGDADNPVEPILREVDKAQVLIWGGQARRALQFLEQEGSNIYQNYPVQAHLLEAEAHLQLQNSAVAHDRLQEAFCLIEEMAMPAFLPQAQKLARHF